MTTEPEQIAKGIPVLGDSFAEHRITGYVTHAMNKGIDPRVDIPLISHVEGAFYQGGCIPGVRLPDGFDYVLSVSPWHLYDVPEGVEYNKVQMYDALDQACDEVDDLAHDLDYRLQEGQTCLVHCQAGLNRSGVVAARTLMLRGHTADDALRILREKRSPLVVCNDGFENWLRSL